MRYLRGHLILSLIWAAFSLLPLLLSSPSVLADDHALTIPQTALCRIALAGLSPGSSAPVSTQVQPEARSSHFWHRLLEMIGMRERSSTRQIDQPTEHENLVQDTEYLFIRILPDAIKHLRDHFSATEVNEILNLAVSSFAHTAQQNYPELEQSFHGRLIADFSYIAVPIDRAALSLERLMFLRNLANQEFKTALKNRAPEALKSLIEHKADANFEVFLMGTGATPLQAKIMASSSRFDRGGDFRFQEARAKMITRFMELPGLLRSLQQVLSLDEIAVLLRKTDKIHELKAALSSKLELRGDEQQIAVSLQRLAHLISIFAHPPKPSNEGLTYNEKEAARFLLAIDVEGAGAAMTSETLHRLVQLFETKKPGEITAQFEKIIEELEPRESRGNMLSTLRKLREIVQNFVQEIDPSNQERVPNAWQTGDEILFALPEWFRSEDVNELVQRLIQETRLKNLRTSVIDTQINPTQKVDPRNHDLLRDISEKLHKKIKAFLPENQRSDFQFFVELSIEEGVLLLKLKPLSENDEQTLNEILLFYHQEISDFAHQESLRIGGTEIEIFIGEVFESGNSSTMSAH